MKNTLSIRAVPAAALLETVERVIGAPGGDRDPAMAAWQHTIRLAQLGDSIAAYGDTRQMRKGEHIAYSLTS